MKFKPNIPIYLQIIDEIKKQIISGELHPGDKLDSVRDLALKYGVNPNTVQRALAQLETELLLRSERTTGRFIRDDEEVIQKLKIEIADLTCDEFLNEMHGFGLADDEIIKGIKRRIEHGNNH